MKRAIIIFRYNNKQQQKAQTLSGWSNFVGKQTLFDQLNKLKKNMYANNGRQHQSNKLNTYNKNSNNTHTEYQDSEMGRYTIGSGDPKSDKSSDGYLDVPDFVNKTSVEVSSLPHMGKLKYIEEPS